MHHAVRRLALLSAASVLAACAAPAPARMPGDAERRAVTDSLTRMVAEAYDFSRPDVVARLMRLYPDSGPVVSAAAGRVTTTRAELEAEVTEFWRYVGQNMQQPKWTWGEVYSDMPSPDAIVLTATYTIPHVTPAGRPHVIGGAWTALFERRGGRWLIVQEHLSDRPAPRDSAGMVGMPGM